MKLNRKIDLKLKPFHSPLHSGFTMIELMITLAIIAIIAAIAIPSYNASTLQSRRNAAQTALEEIINQVQQSFVQNNSYPGNQAINTSGFGASLPNSVNQSPFYTYSLVTCTAAGSSCTAQAVVAGAQARDTNCGCMQLDTNGNRTAFSATNCTGTSTTTTCWAQ